MKLILKSGLLAAMVFALVGSTTAHAAIFGGALPASGCLAGKAKCVIKMKSCMFGCYGKALKGGTPVDQACLTKCRTGFQGEPDLGKGCYAKLDAKNAACGASLGDAAVTRSKIEAHVIDIIGQMNPGLGTLANPCTSGKIKCVTKYNACVLGIVGKAFKAGGPVGDLSKCNAILSGAKSCVLKLETKSPQIDSNQGDPAQCITYGDEGILKAGDDAFVNDIIYGLVAGEQNLNTRRCVSNTFTQCTSDGDCTGGAGDCQFFFGGPLPLSAGGVSTCVTNQWSGALTGTFNQASGASAGTASVRAKVYLAPTVPEPCPRCIGVNDIPNDGVAAGTCSFGPRGGLACDASGESPVPSFGKTSLDCPPSPGTLVGTLPVDLSNTNTGTVTATVTATSPICNGAAGKRCLCSSCSGNSSIPCKQDAECALASAGTCTNGAGALRKPNACDDDTSTVPVPENCAAQLGGEGICPAGPVDSRCNIETFRSCTSQADCNTAPGDSCGLAPRDCYPGYNGNVGDTITAVGFHGTPHNHTGTSNFASVFCVAPTGAAAVNSAAGLPGPGRLQLGGVAFEDGGVACPTIATFLPTSKGSALDTGWTGLAHDAKVVGQGKVTVAATCTGTPGSCSCTYTGPIANP